MSRALYILSILFTILLSTQICSGGNTPRSLYLKEPAVKWENNVITGELRNVPIMGLLAELLRKEGFDWEVIGNLKDKISISFNHLTINESLRKILRLSRFNYALIIDEPEPYEANSANLIKELTIYQDDQVIRFSRTAQRIPVTPKKNFKNTTKPRSRKAVAALPSKAPVGKIKARKATTPPQLSKEEKLAIDKEIRAFADEMLAEKKITAEEYNELMKDIESGKKKRLSE